MSYKIMSMLSFILILNHSFKSMTKSFEIGLLEIFHPLQEERECSIFFCLFVYCIYSSLNTKEKQKKRVNVEVELLFCEDNMLTLQYIDKFTESYQNYCSFENMTKNLW